MVAFLFREETNSDFMFLYLLCGKQNTVVLNSCGGEDNQRRWKGDYNRHFELPKIPPGLLF